MNDQLRGGERKGKRSEERLRYNTSAVLQET